MSSCFTAFALGVDGDDDDDDDVGAVALVLAAAEVAFSSFFAASLCLSAGGVMTVFLRGMLNSLTPSYMATVVGVEVDELEEVVPPLLPLSPLLPLLLLLPLLVLADTTLLPSGVFSGVLSSWGVVLVLSETSCFGRGGSGEEEEGELWVFVGVAVAV